MTTTRTETERLADIISRLNDAFSDLGSFIEDHEDDLDINVYGELEGLLMTGGQLADEVTSVHLTPDLFTREVV
jgi:hypothetical protein